MIRKMGMFSRSLRQQLEARWTIGCSSLEGANLLPVNLPNTSASSGMTNCLFLIRQYPWIREFIHIFTKRTNAHSIQYFSEMLFIESLVSSRVNLLNSQGAFAVKPFVNLLDRRVCCLEENALPSCWIAHSYWRSRKDFQKRVYLFQINSPWSRFGHRWWLIDGAVYG